MTTPPAAQTAPAAARNREPIRAVLAGFLPPTGEVIEIAAGTGEHALYLSAAFPGVTWRPTDPDADARASIEAWRQAEGTPNLQAPEALDASNPDQWPFGRADAIVCINMIHISPWSATEGLMLGAGRLLQSGGVLYLYGPYREAAVETAPSNEAFDADLQRRNPAWGLRILEVVQVLAAAHGLVLAGRFPMPANNLSLVFRKL